MSDCPNSQIVVDRRIERRRDSSILQSIKKPLVWYNMKKKNSVGAVQTSHGEQFKVRYIT